MQGSVLASHIVSVVPRRGEEIVVAVNFSTAYGVISNPDLFPSFMASNEACGAPDFLLTRQGFGSMRQSH